MSGSLPRSLTSVSLSSPLDRLASLQVYFGFLTATFPTCHCCILTKGHGNTDCNIVYRLSKIALTGRGKATLYKARKKGVKSYPAVHGKTLVFYFMLSRFADQSSA